MAEDPKANITVSSDDLKRLAEAASSMNDAAKVIAASMDGVKASVETLEKSIVELAEDMDDAQDSAEYDARVRAEAEQMQAAATAHEPRGTAYSSGEIKDILASIRDMMGDLASAKESAETADQESVESIIGDTVTSAADDFGAGILSRMDTALGLFSDISEQLGVVKTWIDSVPQVVSPAADLSDDETAEPVVEDVPTGNSVTDPLLDEITTQYSELVRSLGDIGETLHGYVDAKTEASIQPVPYPGTEREDTDERDDSGVPELLGIDGRLETIAGSVAGMRELAEREIESANANYSMLADIKSAIGDIATTDEQIPTEARGEVDVPPVQETGEPGATEIIRENTQVVERAIDTIATDRENVPDQNVSNIETDREQPGISADIDRLLDSLSKNHDAVIDAIKSSDSTATDNFAGLYERIDARYDSIGTDNADGAVQSTVPDNTSEPVFSGYGLDGNGLVGDVATSSLDPYQLDSARQNVYPASLDAGMAMGDTAVNTPDSISGMESGDMTASGDTGGLASEAGVTDNMMGLGSDNTANQIVEPSLAIKASSEPDRYGEDAGGRENDGRMDTVHPVQTDDSQVHTGSTVNSVQNTTEVSSNVTQNVNIDLSGNNAEVIRNATMGGMIEALLDDRFKSLIEDSISSIVKQTVRSLVG